MRPRCLEQMERVWPEERRQPSPIAKAAALARKQVLTCLVELVPQHLHVLCQQVMQAGSRAFGWGEHVHGHVQPQHARQLSQAQRWWAIPAQARAQFSACGA